LLQNDSFLRPYPIECEVIFIGARVMMDEVVLKYTQTMISWIGVAMNRTPFDQIIIS